MRILHIVALISPDGAYGGPVRVAANLAEELVAQGHHVTLVGGSRGYSSHEVPAGPAGLRYKLFRSWAVLPGVGFAGLAAPQMLAWLRRHARSYDIAHVHLARDLTVLPAAALLQQMGIPLVIQTHGMIDPSTRVSARLLDRLITRRVLRKAKRVLYLTPQEERDLRAVARRDVSLELLVNGVPLQPEIPAAGADVNTQVAFLARLHPRKRPEVFAQSALELLEEFPQVVFSIAGPDEGGSRAVRDLHRAAGSPPNLVLGRAVAPGEVTRRLANVDAYVLPSLNEPFPMSVLEAMSLGIPVVVTNSCGLALVIREFNAGLVVGPDVSELTPAIRSLLASRSIRREMGSNARRLVEQRFSIVAVVGRLLSVYRAALGSRA